MNSKNKTEGKKDLEELEQRLKDTEKSLVRASIAQVMLRNLSHTVGSHIVNRCRDKPTN